jgi:hypothetical protein
MRIPGNFDNIVSTYLNDDKLLRIDEGLPALGKALVGKPGSKLPEMISKFTAGLAAKAEKEKEGRANESEPESDEEGLDPEEIESDIEELENDMEVAAEEEPEVSTVATPVKRVPINIQKQMVDGAINSALKGGVDPNILKRQVRQAIQQVK